MENINETPTHEESHFCQCVREIEKKDAEKARQVREGYTRLGLTMPEQIDNSRTMSVAERFGLK